jgi:hypothetical protein
MKTATEKRPTLNRDAIARMAWHIWQQEGCQHGRDQENWLKAEQLFLAASQQGSGRTNNANAKSNGAPAKGKTVNPAARGAGQIQQARS